MGLDGKNLTNFTQSFSEALASSSATSRLIGAAAAASSASTSSQSASTSSTWFFLVHPPKLLIAETRRMAAEIDLVTLFALIGLIFVICLYLIHLIALLYGKHRLHRKVKPNSNLPGVSIIKPIVGADENLRENLETFFVADYHKYEILFCFHNQTDPAVKIVKSLIEKYPKIDARLFFGGEKVGLNPKINNMMPAYRSAKYPLILISDSAIFMRQDAILDMVQTMVSHEKMAIVTQTPYCKNRPGLAAAFEQIYFGTFHARIYLAGNCMEFVCSTGMSSMMRKDALDECGGIAAFGGYLAEDFFFGKELANRGWKSAISVNPALQNAANPKISTFLERICRWVKLRIAMLPHIILVEPLQDCFPAGIIIATCANFLMGYNPVLIFAAHVAFWVTVDFLLMHTMQNGELCFATWQFLALWLLREISAPFVFLMALCQPKIEWRKNVFKLAWGGRIVPQK